MTSPDLPTVPGVSSLVPIGRGGFATVYVGYERSFDRRVAVKVLHVDHLDPAVVRRFERECAAMGRMTGHPHVVTVYRAAVLPSGQPALITEYCAGGSLAQRLSRTGPLPVDEVVSIGAKISSALRSAHRLDLIHRDVTPANVLLRESGEPALADFGLSVRADLEASRGLDALSPQHAAPETLASGSYTQASDTYSLGSTLYTLLAGHPPFPRFDGEPVLAHIQRVVQGGVPPLARPDVPDDLGRLLLAMMAPQARDRPPDDAVVGRLEAMAAARPYAPPPPSTWSAGPEPTPVAGTETWSGRAGNTYPGGPVGDDLSTHLRPPAPGSGSRRGRRVALVAGATVLVIGLAGGVAFAAGLLPRHTATAAPTPAPTAIVTTTAAPTTTPPPTTDPPTTGPPTTSPTPPTTTVPTPTSDAPISTATPAAPVPAGYRMMTGTRGIRLAVPDGWDVQAHYPNPTSTNTRVSDPADPKRIVQFAGDPVTEPTVADRVKAIIRDVETRPGYRQRLFEPVAFGGGTAYDWEFSYVKDGATMHAYGRYWRVDATDYVVYAAAPESGWRDLVPVLQTMVDTATPR